VPISASFAGSIKVDGWSVLLGPDCRTALPNNALVQGVVWRKGGAYR
jgi:hypothetical protein